MAGLSEQSIDLKRTIVVLNFPSNVGEDELTIHFQKERNGGGDVDDVVLDGSVAFVTFDMSEVATSVLNHPEQVINGNKIEVQSYESWLANKKKQEGSFAMGNQEDSQPEDAANAVKTIYISDIKDSTTEDFITLFFENRKRSGGGDLCDGKEGYKRLSATVARLTFVSSKDAQNVITKANEKPLTLEGNVLKVSTVFEPTHDRSILLAKNLNPKTNKETFQNFVESTKNSDVLNVVLGKDGKAIVILKNEIDEEYSNVESSGEDLKLEGFIISLEFAPLTKGIRVSNIPPGTTPDAIKFKFSNPKYGGSKVVDMILDSNNGLANVYFEKSSVVSELVKNEHVFQEVPLTVIPYYDEFDELQEITTKTTEFCGDYHLEPLVMDYIMIHQEIETKFKYKSTKYDKANSTFHFTKEFDDSKLAQEFKNELKEFLHSFVKEEVKIPKAVFEKVKEAIEGKKAEFEAEKVDFSFDGFRVTFIGKKEDVILEKRSVEAAIDRILEETTELRNNRVEKTELVIDDKYKLKFLNFIDYFKNVMTEFPGVKIHGMERSSGKLSLRGTVEKRKDVQLRILQDMMKISEIDVNMSDRQIDFLKRTDCQIVNDELKIDDVMLMLLTIKGFVGAKAFQAKIMTLKKCDNTEEKRLLYIIHTKTSEKCIRVDEETASFLAKSNKLHEFKKEIYDKHQVFIDQKFTDPCNIWIVCQRSKMDNAEQELTNLTNEKKIGSSKFRPMDPMKVRFLRDHCWGKIKEKEKSCKAEGITVQEIDSGSLEVKGTQAGRKEMVFLLERLAGIVHFKNFPLTEPGMKKEMSIDTTTAIMSHIEKNHKCVIQRETQPEETDAEKTEEATVIADGGTTAGASVFRSKKSAKTTPGDEGISVKIYSDDRGMIKKAWAELKRKMSQNIQEKTMTGDVIKKFTDQDLEILRKLERDFDVTIKADQSKGNVKIKGHISDISSILYEIHKMMKKITENETNVPDNWDSTLIEGLHRVNLPTSSKEYKDVDTAFHTTAPNQIVRIERIQNTEIYELYNVKRQAMMKKHGSNFTGKELMLFHGTSSVNIEKINAGGLNRSYGGQHATAFGRGVYFARDAGYSCQQTYSPPDTWGRRYMYYAKVLVGEYTQGNPNTIVAPSKNSGNPNETFDSVVNNIATPNIYVMFQDYDYYTEYLITFI